MGWKRRLLVGALALAATGHGAAQSGGSLEIRKSTIDGGGGDAAAGSLHVVGTFGQHDAEFSSNGTLSLRGGFWGAPSTVGDAIFANGFE